MAKVISNRLRNPRHFGTGSIDAPSCGQTHTNHITFHFSVPLTGPYNQSGTYPNVIVDYNRPNVVPPILGCLCLVSLYIFSGAAVIAEAQNWAYLDAIYYW